MLFTVRPVLYDWNDEKQAHSAHDDLLRAAGAARPSRRGDLLRHQAGARELDRELLAGAPHDRLHLSARQETGGRRRRVYALTDAGRDALRGWAAEPTAAPPQYRDEGLLKIFAGADPRPLREPRVDWHRAKLAELQGYLDEVRKADGMESVERTLLAGVAWHRKMLELIDEMASRGEAAPRPNTR